jgi:hypothetical protein
MGSWNLDRGLHLTFSYFHRGSRVSPHGAGLRHGREWEVEAVADPKHPNQLGDFCDFSGELFVSCKLWNFNHFIFGIILTLTLQHFKCFPKLSTCSYVIWSAESTLNLNCCAEDLLHDGGDFGLARAGRAVSDVSGSNQASYMYHIQGQELLVLRFSWISTCPIQKPSNSILECEPVLEWCLSGHLNGDYC